MAWVYNPFTDQLDYTTSGGSGSPSLPFNSIQFNDAGSFGGSSNLLWDNTNKRFQLGDFTDWVGYEPYVKSSNIVVSTAAYPSYQDVYGNLLQYRYGNGATGASGIDIYNLSTQAAVEGNTDLTAAGGGVTDASHYAQVVDSAKVNSIYGLQTFAVLGGTASASTIAAAIFNTTVQALSSATKIWKDRCDASPFDPLIACSPGANTSWSGNSTQNWDP